MQINHSESAFHVFGKVQKDKWMVDIECQFSYCWRNCTQVRGEGGMNLTVLI